MIRRRDALVGLAGYVAHPLTSRAQNLTKRPKLGYLAGAIEADVRPFTNAFRSALARLGYREGQNVEIFYRFGEGDPGRLPELAAELIAVKVDLIVAVTTTAVIAARSASPVTPIVMMNVGDPVGLGLIKSLSRPGGKITGLSFSVGVGTVEKALEILREVTPGTQTLAVLLNPGNPGGVRVLEALKEAATHLGLRLYAATARAAGEIEAAFEIMAREGAGAVFVVADVISMSHRLEVAALALTYRLPSMHQNRAEVDAGGLISYGPDFAQQYPQAAAYVQKILNGADPADLPVEQPTKFELVVNLKTANALGLTIPPTILARADEVIE